METNPYKTSEFYLSAYLQAMGYQAEIERLDGSERAYFVFNIDKDNLERLTQEFFQNNEIQDFIVNIKSLKDKLYLDKAPIKFRENENDKRSFKPRSTGIN